MGIDEKSKGDDSNLDTGHACGIVDNGQPGNNAFILEHLPLLSNCTASEHDNGNIGINNTRSLQTAKRQRPCSSILPHTRTPPLPHNEDGNSNSENIDHSDPGKFPLRRAAVQPRTAAINDRSVLLRQSRRTRKRTRMTRLLAALPTAALPAPPEPALRLNSLFQQNHNSAHSCSTPTRIGRFARLSAERTLMMCATTWWIGARHCCLSTY